MNSNFLCNMSCLVLEVGGNLIDASSLAIKAALKSTMMPKLTIEKGDENDFEISLTDDPLDGDLLQVQPALTVTIAKLGYRYVVDPTDEEEAVANANLVVSIKVDLKTKIILQNKSKVNE